MVELIVGLVIGAAVSLVTVTAVTSSKMCGLYEKIQEVQTEAVELGKEKNVDKLTKKLTDFFENKLLKVLPVVWGIATTIFITLLICWCIVLLLKSIVLMLGGF